MNRFKEKLIEAYYDLKDHDNPDFFNEMVERNSSVIIRMDGHELGINSWKTHFTRSEDYDGPYLESIQILNHRMKRKFIVFERTVRRQEKELAKSWVLERLGVLLKDINTLEPLGYRPMGFGLFTRDNVVSLKRRENKTEIWMGKPNPEWNAWSIMTRKEFEGDDILPSVIKYESEHPENFPNMNSTLRDLIVSS